MNNTKILEECIKNFKQKNEFEHLNDSKAFEVFSLIQVTKDYDLTYTDIEESIIDGGQDGGLDSLIILVNTNFISTLDELEDMNFSANGMTPVNCTIVN